MEYNFYQSKIWKTINSEVYQKPVFDFDFMGKNFFGVVKNHSKLGMNLKWYQVLGIDCSDYIRNYPELFKKEINKVIRDYKKEFGDIFFQFGFVNQIETFRCKESKKDEFNNDVMKLRQSKEEIMKKEYGLLPSIRENMPLATVIIDLQLGADFLRDDMSKSSRNHIKKAIGKKLEFHIAKTDQERAEFYDTWHETSYEKGFNIVPKDTFERLKNYIVKTKKGNLFLAKMNDKIVSGSLCLFVDEGIVYLYGATNRTFGNIGAHHFLKFEMFKRGAQNGYKFTDLLGTAPTGYRNHHLIGVSKFKESLGGKKIEYLGNYDLVFNKALYKSIKLVKKIKA